MAQSQVLKVHYLWLQPESELSSPGPFNSSRLSLYWAASDMGLCTTGASARSSESPKAHPAKTKDERLTDQGMRSPKPIGKVWDGEKDAPAARGRAGFTLNPILNTRLEGRQPSELQGIAGDLSATSPGGNPRGWPRLSGTAAVRERPQVEQLKSPPTASEIITIQLPFIQDFV